MAADKTGVFVRSKYYTLFWKTPLKWIPHSKSGASKSRPRWAAHSRIGNVWVYRTPPPPQHTHTHPRTFSTLLFRGNKLQPFFHQYRSEFDRII